MLPGSCFSTPILAWWEYGRCRSGLSNRTMPAFFCVAVAGYSVLRSVRFTTGPLRSIGSVGSRPAEGPASTLLAGNDTVNDADVAPDATSGVKFEYAVFWKYSP